MDIIAKNSLVVIKTLSLSHPVLTIFLLVQISGEPGLLCLAFLSAQHIFPLALVAAISYVSALVGELFWFFIGRTKLFHFIEKWFVRTGVSDAFIRLTKHINPQHPFKTLLLTRFITGLTIPVIVYLSRKGTSLKTFFTASLIVNLIWIPTISMIGWLSGKGFTLILKTFNDIELAISILVVTGAAGLIIEKKLRSRLINKKQD